MWKLLSRVRHEPGKSDYFQLKGYVELLLRRYGAKLSQMRCEAAPSDIFSEGMTYSIPGGRDRKLLSMGTVNPVLARRFGVRQPVFAAEIDWNALFELVKRDIERLLEACRKHDERKAQKALEEKEPSNLPDNRDATNEENSQLKNENNNTIHL